MTFRSREEYQGASEEFAPFHQTGSVLFALPSEVNHWCQSVPAPEGFPPTPPDTASDCAASDYSDMALPTWNMTSLPGDGWTTVPAQDHSTNMQPSASRWPNQGTSVTSQELHAMDAASWIHTANGPVDLGLSPVLSHESQNSHTLHSFSEPDVPFLPPGLDLSFIGENTWQASGQVVYPESQCVPQEFSSGMAASQQHMPQGVANGQYTYGSRSHVGCGPQQNVTYIPDAHGPHPRRSDCEPSMVLGRPLLPRTDDYPFQCVPPSAGYVALRPVHQEPHGIVSSAPGMPREAVMSSRRAPTRTTMYMEAIAQAGTLSPLGQMPTPRSDGIPVGIPSSITGSANEDYNSFLQYDQDDKVPVTSRSYSGYAPSDPRSALNTPVQDGASRKAATSSAGLDMPNETDEGRYRNHPLYSEGPHADGLYHCPFTSDPSCQHKATKLKCNYEYDICGNSSVFLKTKKMPMLTLRRSKFIDSHLKPFRCKVDACAKQEFSSTACLLRHEREAHGMHGHGERPHLCLYPGCERGHSGNGFPRRYNLYDHMKRVHDHKEAPSTATQDKSTAGPQIQRKSGSRKRKASTTSDEPAAQRVKVQAVREPVTVAPSVPTVQVPQYHDAHAGVQNQPNDQNRQSILYTQWAQQRDLVNFQMSSVQGPDDEANLQRLSQNIEELRRLSQQARQG